MGDPADRERRSDSPPFSMILAGLAAFNAVEPQHNPTVMSDPAMYQGSSSSVEDGIIRTIASMAVCVTLAYCRRRGREWTLPDPNASFVSNVMRMMGFGRHVSNELRSEVVKTLERIWVLYCDHELTNSTAAFLHAASALADPISCCSALIASGYGPLHAGAIELAYKNFERLDIPEKVPAMIADVKARKYRLFGYGHRIYKTTDPRAKYIKDILDRLAHRRSSPLLQVALEIDRIASEDQYFVSRNLKANADLYGCFAYTAL